MTYYKTMDVTTRTYVLIGILGAVIILWMYLSRNTLKPLYSLF
ncbi:hypothetical protein LCDVSa151L [Lymphocystis disease virus 3]|uniref:Uncharacterized protein n=1 Tax=Lymphocystis disease virus 3 TaxID=2560566 RepID=A0A1B2RW67_9VIRU|nr:hypothetical protein BZK12_gp151 [Lymphocystis disease virus Sa]AOC55235.1 hypothetical protein LCDVSa151L [Lymphocystis disease virus 3]